VTTLNTQATIDATAQVCLTAESVNAKPCARCGVMFTFKRSTAKFCSDSCRNKAAECVKDRKTNRQARRLDYQQRQRSAVVGCVAVGERRRDVGLLKDIAVPNKSVQPKK
jgi:hypothetical protein